MIANSKKHCSSLYFNEIVLVYSNITAPPKQIACGSNARAKTIAKDCLPQEEPVKIRTVTDRQRQGV
jgi:hypothetical protein